MNGSVNKRMGGVESLKNERDVSFYKTSHSALCDSSNWLSASHSSSGKPEISQVEVLLSPRVISLCFYRRNDWLAELKRSLPRERSEEGGQLQNEVFRPSSAPRLHSRSTVSTPAFYSSDDEDFDTEVETAYESPYGGGGGSRIGRGRKIERVHSETAFDRIHRAPNVQTYASRSGHGDFQRTTGFTPGFPTCPPTPYLNRPLSPAKPPRSPKSTLRNIQIHSSSNPTTPTTPT